MAVRAVVDSSALASFLAATDGVTAGHGDPLTAWTAYEQENAALFAAYLDGWGNAGRRPAAAAAMAATAAGLRAASLDWKGLLSRVASAMTSLVEFDVEIPVAVFVGMSTSNGWVTSLGGQQTVFLAAELISDLALGAVLAAHELTHALQLLADPEWGAGDYPLSALTFAEGLATHLSAVAVPGHRDDEYLWFDATHETWLTDCRQAWPVAGAALREVLDQPCGGAAERSFFTLHPALGESGIPSRFGYYTALRLVRQLARTHTITELLTLDVPTAGQLVRDYLDQLTARELTDG